jgi:hypothetical protein
VTHTISFAQIRQQRNAAVKELDRRRRLVRQAFRPPRIRVLSPEEQLERFLRMTQADFDALIRKRGPWAVEQYIRAMERMLNG